MTSILTDTTCAKSSAVQERVELHLHTKHSKMDGLCDVKATLEKAHKLGHRAVAITDHGVVRAFPKAMLAADEIRKIDPDFKLIYGAEVYLVDLDKPHNKSLRPRTYHLTILVKTQAGMKNLYRIISASHINYYHRVPRVPRSLLSQYREGLLIGSACESGELYQALVMGQSFEALCKIASFYDFLEVQPLSHYEYLIRNERIDSVEQLKQHNKTIILIGKALGIPVVATGDVHFLEPDDAVCRVALKSAMGFPDANLQPPFYFHTTSDMLAQFDYLPDETAYEIVVENSNKLADYISNEVRAFPRGFAFSHIIADAKRLSLSDKPPCNVDFSCEHLLSFNGELRLGTTLYLHNKTICDYILEYAKIHNLAISATEHQRIMQGCAGVTRCAGQGLGDVISIPSSYPIYDICPIQYPLDDQHTGAFITHFDCNDLC